MPFRLLSEKIKFSHSIIFATQPEEARTRRLFLWHRSLRWGTFAAVKSAVAAVDLTDNIQNKVGQPQPQWGEEGAVQPVVSLLQVVPCRAVFLM